MDRIAEMESFAAVVDQGVFTGAARKIGLSELNQNESIRLDSELLQELYFQLGETGANDVVCRAFEELTTRVSHTERFYRQARFMDMHKSARSVITISEQIGMQLLARVASDVVRRQGFWDR